MDRLCSEASVPETGVCGDGEGKSWQSHNPKNPGSDKSVPKAGVPAGTGAVLFPGLSQNQ